MILVVLVFFCFFVVIVSFFFGFLHSFFFLFFLLLSLGTALEVYGHPLDAKGAQTLIYSAPWVDETYDILIPFEAAGMWMCLCTVCTREKRERSPRRRRQVRLRGQKGEKKHWRQANAQEQNFTLSDIFVEFSFFFQAVLTLPWCSAT